MPELSDAHALAVERSCAVTAVALSGQRREGVRLVSGARRDFGLSSTLDFVHVPYPPPSRTWTRRTLTCGVALQCSPSKDRIVDYRLNELSARELSALTLVEASVALGWIAAELARAAARDSAAAARPRRDGRRHGRRRDAQSRSRTGADIATAGRRPAARYPPEGIHRPAEHSPTNCAGLSAGCRGPRRRSDCRGRTRFPSVATVACATPTCRRRAGRRTTTST